MGLEQKPKKGESEMVKEFTVVDKLTSSVFESTVGIRNNTDSYRFRR